MLVLSGSHVSIIGVVIGFILRFPWWFYYVLGRLDVLTWIKVSTVSHVWSAALLLAYCAAAGLSQSLQRAFFCFIVATIFPIFGIFRKKFSRVLIALCLQAVLCPMNFLSIGLIMSWTGVLVLISFTESSYLKPLWRLIVDAVLIQSVFFIVSLVFFGRIGVLALPANLVFHAIFSVVLPIDVIGLILPSSFIDHWIVILNLGCLSCIEWLWKFQMNLSISEIIAPGLVTFANPDGRLVIILIVIGLCITSRFRELGIRDH
jgi:predicted membrane metal-binding protein